MSFLRAILICISIPAILAIEENTVFICPPNLDATSGAEVTYPDSQDITKFFICSNNIAYLQRCASGTYFNAISKECTNLLVDESPSENHSRRVRCPKRDGKYPVYIPHKDCSKFYECSNGTPYLFDCPIGLHFNWRKRVCDYPYRAGCKRRAD